MSKPLTRDLMIAENRVNALLQLCCMLDRGDSGYRYVWRVCATMQLTIDVASFICRNIVKDPQCGSTREIAKVLHEKGILSRDSMYALIELENMLEFMKRLGGPELMQYISNTKDTISRYIMMVAHDLLRYLENLKTRYR